MATTAPWLTLKSLSTPTRSASGARPARCRCGSPVQFVFRAAGWVVACRNYACPFPAARECDGNPTQTEATRYWHYRLGRMHR